MSSIGTKSQKISKMRERIRNFATNVGPGGALAGVIGSTAANIEYLSLVPVPAAGSVARSYYELGDLSSSAVAGFAVMAIIAEARRRRSLPQTMRQEPLTEDVNRASGH